MTKISVVINTLNEEKNLGKALSSVKEIAHEVIVVDMHSEDKTREIAEKFGAKVFLHDRTGYVEPARNFAISKAKSEWLLILDADEEVTHELARNIIKAVESNAADYYALPRKNIIFGKWIKHTKWWPDYNIRLFKKGHVAFSDVIHAIPFTTGRGLDFEAREENALVHKNYQTIEQFIERLNRYTTNHAKILLTEGYKFEWSDILRKPAGEFLGRFFQERGYKDGLHGLALSLLQAFSELILILKVWQAEKFKEKEPGIRSVIKEMKKFESEVHYWQADTLLNEEGGLGNRIKRKFRLP